MKITYWFASMLKFCGVENESTKDHADYMNFFFLPCIVQICYIFSCYFILHSFCSWYTSWYFNFHISLILIPTWLWCRYFSWQKSYSVPPLSFLTSTALPALFFTKNRKKLTMNHLNCVISDHEHDNSSVECLSKWLATCSNLHCLEFSLRKAI